MIRGGFVLKTNIYLFVYTMLRMQSLYISQYKSISLTLQ